MKIIKIQFIIILLFFVCPVLAQDVESETEMNTMRFGEYSIEYDLSEEISQNHTVYKKNGEIVLSIFDTDENGQDDLWLRYNEDLVLDLEASDSDGDGEPDTFVSLDSEENVTNLKAPEFVLEEVVLPQNPNPEQKVQPVGVTALEVFVVEPPPTEDEFSFSIKWIALILVIGAVVFLILKSKKK